MRRFFLFLTTMLLIAVGPHAAYSQEKEQPAAPEATQQKQQYEKSMEERLKKLGKELDELKAKAATMTEHARKDIHRDLAQAEKNQKAASQKLEDMRKESVMKWKKFTSETDAAVDEFEKAFEKAKAHYKE